MHPFGDSLEWSELETAQEAIMALNSAFSEQRSLAAFSKHLRASNSISVLSRRFIYIYIIIIIITIIFFTRYWSRCFSI